MDTKKSLKELFSEIEKEANLKIEQLKGKIKFCLLFNLMFKGFYYLI